MPFKDPDMHKAYLREYAAKNREAAVERVRAWRLANPEKRAEQNKRYAEKHPEKVKEKGKRWRLANPERLAEISKNTRTKNKARVTANKAKYRAGKTNRTPAWLTEFDLLKIKCLYSIAAMLTRENKEAWHVDHILPLHGKTVSGLHVPSNLQVIRGAENQLKNNKFEVEHV